MTAPEAQPRTATLTWAVWLLLLQVAGLAVLTVLLVYLDVVAQRNGAETAISITVFVALWTGIMAGVSLSLGRRRRWARAPAIVIELLNIALGYGMVRTGGLLPVGIPLLAVSLVCAGLLLAPGTRRALGLPDDR